jgi:putative nucleotidyltransferase with HDIG domain
MMWKPSAPPPRLVVRTTVATFIVAAFVLSAVLAVIGIQGSGYVRSTVADKLAAGQRMLSALEQRQSRELQAQVAMLAENPTLKAAIDTYRYELDSPSAGPRADLVETIQRELEKLATRLEPDVVAVSDPEGRMVAVAGRYGALWPASLPVPKRGGPEQFVSLPSGVFRRVTARITIQETELGLLELATALDQDYAAKLSALSGAKTLVMTEGRVVATTLPADAAAALTPQVLAALAGSRTVSLAGSEYAIQLLFQPGAGFVYALDSIDASVGPVLSEAVRAMSLIALGAFAIAGLASAWMARSLSRPIDRLSQSLAEMTRSRSFGSELPVTHSSREVDALTQTFNTMIRTVSDAQAETRSAYIGAIRALALALDARDPYTAGHSERVSAISAAVGRAMGLDDDDLDVLRLGALLHDIGKIGISDNVLRKPDGLTPDEFELIREHPSLGARILRTVPFLAPHVPIVELHHERPDGRGYPYGLTTEQTPLLARIVHVADAFDAMTSARAYRPARGSAEAVSELWRCAGTQFDAEVVQALVHALPMIGSLGASAEPAVDIAAFAATRRLALVAGS